MIDRSRPLLLGLFLLSGGAGLMHEIAWTRVLRHLLGGSTLALTSVLVAFFAGLAIGAWCVARLRRRRRSPLALFAAVEIAIGVWTLALPALAERTWPLWRAAYDGSPGVAFALARFCGALLLLAPAAVAMGASLPLLAGCESDRRGRWIARLYGANALGATAGALTAAFWILPQFGLAATVRVAAGINLLVGFAAWALDRAAPQRDPGRDAESPAPSAGGPVLLGLYVVAGAALLVHEIGWARLSTLLLGSTVYAVGLLLATVVGGLAAGGLLAARWVRDDTTASTALAASQAAAAAAGFAIVAAAPSLPPAITGWFARSAGSGLAVVAAVLAASFLAPCVAMGAAYPLVCRLALGAGSARRPAARAQLAGNLGAVIGALLAAFVLLPAAGLRATLLVAAGLNALVACGVLLRRGARRAAAGVALAAAVAAVAVPAWPASRISFGPFVQARRQPLEVATSPGSLNRIEAGQRVLYHRDGRESSVTVKETADGERSLWINGKPDASSVADLATQRLLAHVPLALHAEARTALVVGLASGVTAASAARHPLDRIVAVEISDRAAEVARWFSEANGDVLADPRVELVVADARLHLTLTDERFDVIVSEPSNPWMAGIGDLFTREFFLRVAARLNPGGTFCLWLPAYHLDATGFRSVVRTYREVFPHAALWHTQGSDFLLVGSVDPRPPDPRAVAERLARPGVSAELAALGITDGASFFAQRVLHGESLARFSAGAPRHTDDNALLEFRAPRYLLRNPDEGALLLAIESFRDPRPGFPVADDRIERANRARGAAIRANLLFAAGQGERAVAWLARAAADNPADAYLERTLAANQAHADRLAAEGRRQEALARYRRLLAIAPGRRATREGLARLEQDF